MLSSIYSYVLIGNNLQIEQTNLSVYLMRLQALSFKYICNIFKI